MLTPPAPAPAKKLSRKEEKAAKEAEKVAAAARVEFLSKLNADLTRLAEPAKRGVTLPADVRLAGYRPVKVLADAVKK